MSTREAGEVLGVGKSTVADDIAAVQNRTPKPEAALPGDPPDAAAVQNRTPTDAADHRCGTASLVTKPHKGGVRFRIHIRNPAAPQAVANPYFQRRAGTREHAADRKEVSSHSAYC